MTDYLARWESEIRRGIIPPNDFKPKPNMNTTAKVTKVEDTGKMYKDFKKIYVELDNGSKGTVNAKSFPPPYGVGDLVEIKATWDDGNLKSIAKVSEDVPNARTGNSGASQGHSRPEYDPLPGFCANNLGTAIRLVQDDNGDTNYDQSQVINKMLELHKLHSDVVLGVRALLEEGK